MLNVPIFLLRLACFIFPDSFSDFFELLVTLLLNFLKRLFRVFQFHEFCEIFKRGCLKRLHENGVIKIFKAEASDVALSDS